jgi:hypothetical protein
VAVSELDARIEDSKNWFERAALHVPGYKGYKQKEMRREADKLQRQYVAERLEMARKDLEKLELALTRGGGLELLALIDTAQRKLRTIKNRYQTADYGYAGMFDIVKVDEDILDRLYEFDVASQDQARGVEELVSALKADSPSLKSDLALLDERVDALDEYFMERKHLITGVGRS